MWWLSGMGTEFTTQCARYFEMFFFYRLGFHVWAEERWSVPAGSHAARVSATGSTWARPGNVNSAAAFLSRTPQPSCKGGLKSTENLITACLLVYLLHMEKHIKSSGTNMHVYLCAHRRTEQLKRLFIAFSIPCCAWIYPNICPRSPQHLWLGPLLVSACVLHVCSQNSLKCV